jgi:hypothetical protein
MEKHMKKLLVILAMIGVPALFVACGKSGGGSSSNCTPQYTSYGQIYSSGSCANAYGYTCQSGYSYRSTYNSCCPSGSTAMPAGSGACVAAVSNGYYGSQYGYGNYYGGGYSNYYGGGYYYYYPSYYPGYYGYGGSGYSAWVNINL